jgi:hypothetical protein
MAKDRARDDRRSIGSHEKMMGALGRASLSNISESNPHDESLATWVVPQSVRSVDSPGAKIDKAYKQGRITSDERASERVFEASGDDYRFHKGIR